MTERQHSEDDEKVIDIHICGRCKDSGKPALMAENYRLRMGIAEKDDEIRKLKDLVRTLNGRLLELVKGQMEEGK